MSTVLVTGGSGFIGSHVILQLLAAEHKTPLSHEVERDPEQTLTPRPYDRLMVAACRRPHTSAGWPR